MLRLNEISDALVNEVIKFERVFALCSQGLERCSLTYERIINIYKTYSLSLLNGLQCKISNFLPLQERHLSVLNGLYLNMKLTESIERKQ